MKLLMRNRSARNAGSRLNQWKGARASQAADERQQVQREKLFAWGRRALRMGQGIVGLAALAWGLAFAAGEMGPVLQKWLEIQSVTVEGIHHVTKPEVEALLALKPGVGLHQVSVTFLAERVRTHFWIKEAVVERRLPHVLHVTILERTPAAIIRTDVDHWLSDETGHLLAKLGSQEDLTLPLLVGLESKALLLGDPRARNAVQSGVVLAKLIASTIEGRVEVDLANLSNVVVSTDRARFQFGNDSLIGQWERFQKLKPLFRAVAFDGRKHEASEIDLRYDNRVIVRERG
ncbi:MAG: Cell division protein FtsQ [Nitrospira sp.]|nr:Cell division protein FtsQ [Nitrospira sp.]